MTNYINPDQIKAFKDSLSIANKLFNTNAQTWDDFIEEFLPLDVKTIKRLGAMYEQQTLLCSDAKAYFSACVMSASMLEAFLMLVCMLHMEEVATTKRYKDRAGKGTDDFNGAVCRLGLEDFIEISAELNWVPPSVISEEWKTMLPSAFHEMMAEYHPNMSKAKREERANSLIANPAYSLMFLLNMMRNKMHPGRWVRQKHELQNQEAFAGWAQVALLRLHTLEIACYSSIQAALIEYCKRLMLTRLNLKGVK